MLLESWENRVITQQPGRTEIFTILIMVSKSSLSNPSSFPGRFELEIVSLDPVLLENRGLGESGFTSKLCTLISP